MDHIAIVERAIRTTLRHRALWVLGTLWALMGGCGGAGGGSGGGPQFNMSGDEDAAFREAIKEVPFLAGIAPETLVGLAMAACCAAFALLLITTVARYVLQAGIFRSLDELYSGGSEPGVKSAWREGWNRRTWRLWLQNLVVDIPFAIIAIISALLLLLPGILLLFATSDGEPAALGIVAIVGLFFGWLLLLIVAGSVVSVLKELWWREAVVGDESFLTAIQRGFRLARDNVSDLAVMWLIMVAATLIWGGIVFAVFIASVLLGLGLAGVPAWALVQSGREALAAIYGVPVGLIVVFLPVLVAGGLFLVFEAAVWTQVYQVLVGRREAGASGPSGLPATEEA